MTGIQQYKNISHIFHTTVCVHALNTTNLINKQIKIRLVSAPEGLACCDINGVGRLTVSPRFPGTSFIYSSHGPKYDTESKTKNADSWPQVEFKIIVCFVNCFSKNAGSWPQLQILTHFQKWLYILLITLYHCRIHVPYWIIIHTSQSPPFL